jgi:hypothetical protein
LLAGARAIEPERSGEVTTSLFGAAAEFHSKHTGQSACLCSRLCAAPVLPCLAIGPDLGYAYLMFSERTAADF